MQATCPKCRQVIPVENIAMATGWAKCARCNEVFQLSEVLPDSTAVSAPEPLPERPFDARAIVERSADKLVVQVPWGGGFKGHLGWLALALFVLACIAILTAEARDLWLHREMGWDELPVACFMMLSLIFFFWVFLGHFFSTWGGLTIYIDALWMVAESRAPLRWRRRRKIDRSAVQGARKAELELGLRRFFLFADIGSYRPGIAPGPAVFIVCEDGSLWLPCGSDAEAEWLAGQINAFLQSVPYKAPLLAEGPRDRGLTRAREDDRFHS